MVKAVLGLIAGLLIGSGLTQFGFSNFNAPPVSVQDKHWAYIISATYGIGLILFLILSEIKEAIKILTDFQKKLELNSYETNRLMDDIRSELRESNHWLQSIREKK